MLDEKQTDDEDQEDQDGEMQAVEPDNSDVTDTDDGGAIVKIGNDDEADEEKAVVENENFYENIVEDIDNNVLATMAIALLEKIELDKKSRQKRIDQYMDALQRTGLGKDSPGGAQFEGASKVTHPLLIEATIDYSSRSVAELIPPNGPVKMYLPETEDIPQERADKAKRKSNYMNWQFKTQMREFKPELEQLQPQEALAGVAYMRLVYDGDKRRPVPTFIPVDDIYLPFACSSFYTSERVTWAETITTEEFNRRIKSDMYRAPTSTGVDGKVPAPTMAPEKSKAAEANDKIEGKDSNTMNEDGQRRVFLIQINCTFEEDSVPEEDREVPYLVSIDENTREIVSIVRNWEIDDKQYEVMYWIIEWPFIPWRGAYPIGLNQVMAGIPAAVTGALRALLDSAHINNLPTLLKLKGANMMGQSTTANVTQITDIEGGISGDDIRKLLMAIPYNPPSTVLFSLMGLLVETGKGVVRTTFDNLAQNTQLPATTAMALIEQGMKVMSAIHLRQWTAMDNTINVLHRINRLYITDDEIKDETGTLLARRSDFQGPLDCIPTADPQVFSDVQRFAQINLIASRATGNPLYNQRKVEEAILERIRFPNAKDLLLPESKPTYMNAVNENVAMTLGRPVTAFPNQDHLAHIQILLDYLTNPFLGSLSIIAQSYIGPALTHLKEHIVMWYVSEAYQLGTEAAGKDLSELMKGSDDEAKKELDRLLATISQQGLMALAKQNFGKLPGIIQSAQQLLQSLSPPMPTDPSQAMIATTQAKIAGDMQKTQLIQDRTDQRQQREDQVKLIGLQQKEAGDSQRTETQIESKEQMNKEDNLTALTIAGSEINAGNKSNLSTGTGINPSP